MPKWLRRLMLKLRSRFMRNHHRHRNTVLNPRNRLPRLLHNLTCTVPTAPNISNSSKRRSRAKDPGVIVDMTTGVFWFRLCLEGRTHQARGPQTHTIQ